MVCPYKIYPSQIGKLLININHLRKIKFEDVVGKKSAQDEFEHIFNLFKQLTYT